MQNGERRAGAAVVSKDSVIWAQRRPDDTSAQKAELVALVKALQMAAGKRLTVYMDSRYAFATTAHIHGAIYAERGFRTSEGRPVKHAPLVQDLLDAVQLPARLAIVHCRGHQKNSTLEARGNQKADDGCTL